MSFHTYLNTSVEQIPRSGNAGFKWRCRFLMLTDPEKFVLLSFIHKWKHMCPIYVDSLQKLTIFKVVSNQLEECPWCVHLHLTIRVHQALSCLFWHTCAHKEAEGSFTTVSRQQIIANAPKASNPLSCLWRANSKMPCRAWENGRLTSPVSSIVPQALKQLCLSPEPYKVPMTVVTTPGHHTLPGIVQASHEKQLSVSVPLIRGPQTQIRGLDGKQMPVCPLCFPSSHNKSSRAQEGTEKREVVLTVKVSRPSSQSAKCPTTQAFLFILWRTWGSFWEGTQHNKIGKCN